MELTAPKLFQPALDALTQMQSDQFVRVVLRAPEQRATSDEPKPSDFDTSVAYRMALIERNSRAHLSSKSLIEQLAQSLGLSAHSASTLNAVAVEGRAGQVLKLLDQVPVSHIVLDSPLTLSQPAIFKTL